MTFYKTFSSFTYPNPNITMKTIIFVILLLCSLRSDAQIVTYEFRNFRVVQIREIIMVQAPRLKETLLHTGFNDNDSIHFKFHYTREYVQVLHNIKDEQRIELLFRQIFIHCATLKYVIDHQRFTHLRIFVHLEKNVYLYTDLTDNMLKPRKKRMPAKEFTF